ncbi:MAG: hypothetical protein AAF547_17550 [Actinomycetota bacterium]
MKKSWMVLWTAVVLLAAACGSTATEETTAGAAPGDEPVSSADSTVVVEDGVPGDTADVDAGSTADDGSTDQPSDDQAATDGALPASAGGDSPIGALLDTSFDPTSPVSSARFEATVSVVAGADADLPGQLAFGITGAYDLSRDATQLSIDLSSLAEAAADTEGADGDLGFMLAFFSGDIEMISIGDQSWIKWDLLSMFTGQTDVWLEGDPAESEDVTAEIGVDASILPADTLGPLVEAEAEITVVGQETLRGVETTHYRALVDLASLAEAEGASVEEDLGVVATGTVPVDLWIDADGLLHRYVIDLSDAVAVEGDEDDFAGGSITFDLWDHGEDVGIQPPPADEVVTADELSLFGTDDFDDAGFDDSFSG